jgi:hypothetical protein
VEQRRLRHKKREVGWLALSKIAPPGNEVGKGKNFFFLNVANSKRRQGEKNIKNVRTLCDAPKRRKTGKEREKEPKRERKPGKEREREPERERKGLLYKLK